MKNFKKIISIIMIGLIAFTAFNKVKAVSETITLGPPELLYPYMDDIIDFSIKQTTSGELLYCIDSKAETARDVKATLIGKGDAGLTYILENGYPNKTFTGNDKKDYYLTQVAVWMYLDDTTGSKNLTSEFRNNTGEMMNHVKRLVANAKQAKDQSAEIKLDITASTTNMKLEDNYYVSDFIKATTISGISSYNVTVSGAEGAEIVDSNNEPISTITGSNSFRVRIPANNVTDQTSVIVTATSSKSYYQSYKYKPANNNMQNVARLVKNTKNVKSLLTLTASRPSVTITKIDAETKENLPGAIIAIYNENGSEVRRFTTTTESYIITDLEDGSYTVKEVSAPSGYMKNESTFKFTIDDENRTHTITIENYKEVIVPDTDTTSTLIGTIIGIIVSGIGVLFIRRYGKKA